MLIYRKWNLTETALETRVENVTTCMHWSKTSEAEPDIIHITSLPIKGREDQKEVKVWHQIYAIHSRQKALWFILISSVILFTQQLCSLTGKSLSSVINQSKASDIFRFLFSVCAFTKLKSKLICFFCREIILFAKLHQIAEAQM